MEQNSCDMEPCSSAQALACVAAVEVCSPPAPPPSPADSFKNALLEYKRGLDKILNSENATTDFGACFLDFQLAVNPRLTCFKGYDDIMDVIISEWKAAREALKGGNFSKFVTDGQLGRDCFSCEKLEEEKKDLKKEVDEIRDELHATRDTWTNAEEKVDRAQKMNFFLMSRVKLITRQTGKTYRVLSQYGGQHLIDQTKQHVVGEEIFRPDPQGKNQPTEGERASKKAKLNELD